MAEVKIDIPSAEDINKQMRFWAMVAETTGIAATGDYRINLCSYKKAFTLGYQCSLAPGPGKLYCKPHAKMVELYYKEKK